MRARYAALRVQESVKRYADEARRALGVTVQIRVSLNSGEFVVGAIGANLKIALTTGAGPADNVAGMVSRTLEPKLLALARRFPAVTVTGSRQDVMAALVASERRPRPLHRVVVYGGGRAAAADRRDRAAVVEDRPL